MKIEDEKDETNLLLTAFEKYRKAYVEDALNLELAQYGHIATPNDLPYGEMLQEQPTTLANEINRFSHHIEQLAAWSRILPEYPDEARLVLLGEFVEATANVAIGTPYALRSRFIFCASHASHQANLLIREGWLESRLPADKKIDRTVLSSVAENWNGFTKLLDQIDQLGTNEFLAATNDYRHKYNHRLPARFELGLTQFVTRTLCDGKASYGIGFVRPLELSKLVPTLVHEHKVAMACFEAYSNLLREQLAAVAVAIGKGN